MKTTLTMLVLIAGISSASAQGSGEYTACIAAMKLQGAGPFITIDAARDYAAKHPECLGSAPSYRELPVKPAYNEEACTLKYLNLLAAVRGITIMPWNIKELDEEARSVCRIERAKGLR